MFYFDKVCGKKVVRSDLIKEADCFFTTRDFCLFSKSEDMSHNVRLLEDYLGEIPACNQPVHGINIAKIVPSKKFYKETDGVLIEGQGAAFMNFGDCTPLVFYCDHVVMISHAGWRGTAQQMARVSIQRLVDDYGFEPKDIKVIIGPAICKDCYNVGEDVYLELYKTVENPKNLFEKKNGKFFVDLKGINKQQLIECGVKQIDVCPYCTACGEKLFYSYRYENQTGYRHSAVVKL
jgi:YfiH family protein